MLKKEPVSVTHLLHTRSRSDTSVVILQVNGTYAAKQRKSIKLETIHIRSPAMSNLALTMTVPDLRVPIRDRRMAAYRSEIMEYEWNYSVSDHKLQRKSELLTAYSKQLLWGERRATNVKDRFSTPRARAFLASGVQCTSSRANQIRKRLRANRGSTSSISGTSRILCFKFWCPRIACETIQKMRDDLKFLIFYGAKALFDTFLETSHIAILCYSRQIHSSVVPRNDLQMLFSVVKCCIASVNKLNDKVKSVIVVCFLLGNYPASGFYMPTFRNTLSVPSS